MFPVQSQPDGRNDSTLTFNASPGSAPSVHRPGHRVDSGEVELVQVGRRGGPRELPGRGVEGLEVQGLARRDLQAGGNALFQPWWIWSR